MTHQSAEIGSETLKALHAQGGLPFFKIVFPYHFSIFMCLFQSNSRTLTRNWMKQMTSLHSRKELFGEWRLCGVVCGTPFPSPKRLPLERIRPTSQKSCPTKRHRRLQPDQLPPAEAPRYVLVAHLAVRRLGLQEATVLQQGLKISPQKSRFCPFFLLPCPPPFFNLPRPKSYQRRTQEQDSKLDDISSILAIVKNQGRDMNQELGRQVPEFIRVSSLLGNLSIGSGSDDEMSHFAFSQNQLLDRIDTKTDSTANRLQNVNTKTKRLLWSNAYF